MSDHPLQQFRSRELVARIVSAILLAPVFLLVYYLGGIPLLVMVLVLVVGVCWEFNILAAQAGYSIAGGVIYAASIILVVAAFLKIEAAWPLAAAMLLTTPLWTERSQTPTKATFANWAITAIGFLYSGGLLHHMILLRDLGNGLEVGLMATLGTWMSDAGAYFVGKNFGRRKFAPLISPKKTWEGAIGGLLAGFLAVLLVGLAFRVELVHALALGVIIPLAGISGDLTESLLKRSANVKDSSHLIPGHGGLLDRIDSLMFTFVAAYYYVIYVMGAGG